MITRENTREATMNRTVANSTGVRVARTTRAATKERPPITETLKAAKAPQPILGRLAVPRVTASEARSLGVMIPVDALRIYA
jgi:hypothetical protein